MGTREMELRPEKGHVHCAHPPGLPQGHIQVRDSLRWQELWGTADRASPVHWELRFTGHTAPPAPGAEALETGLDSEAPPRLPQETRCFSASSAGAQAPCKAASHSGFYTCKGTTSLLFSLCPLHTFLSFSYRHRKAVDTVLLQYSR